MNGLNKKLLASFMMILLLLFSFPVCAQGNSVPAISLSSAVGSAGDEVTVEIMLTNNPGIAYLKLEIDYDTTLSVSKAENNGVLSGTFTTSKSTGVKPYVLQWMGAADSYGNGAIADVTFKIPENAKEGVKAISFNVTECYNQSFEDVLFNTSGGGVTVKETEHQLSQIKISSCKAKFNEEIKLDVLLENNPGIAYLKIKLDYDNTALMLIGADNSNVLGGTFTTSKSTDVKPYVLQWMAAENSTGDGKIAEVSFKALKSGTFTVLLTVEECYNEAFGDVGLDVTNGSIEVLSHIPGDINDDGETNNKDLTRLFQRLCGWNVTVNESAIDINGDGKINNKDLIRLFQYLSGWDVAIF